MYIECDLEVAAKSSDGVGHEEKVTLPHESTDISVKNEVCSNTTHNPQRRRSHLARHLLRPRRTPQLQNAPGQPVSLNPQIESALKDQANFKASDDLEVDDDKSVSRY